MELKMLLNKGLLLLSILVNGFLFWFIVDQQLSVRRNFKLMRSVSEEWDAAKIVHRLGLPEQIFFPGEERDAWPDIDTSCPKIKKCAYLYSTPEMRCIIYVDKDGHVDNIRCR